MQFTECESWRIHTLRKGVDLRKREHKTTPIAKMDKMVKMDLEIVRISLSVVRCPKHKAMAALVQCAEIGST